MSLDNLIELLMGLYVMTVVWYLKPVIWSFPCRILELNWHRFYRIVDNHRVKRLAGIPREKERKRELYTLADIS